MAKERVVGNDVDSDVSKCGRLTIARWLVRRMRDIVNVMCLMKGLLMDVC